MRPLFSTMSMTFIGHMSCSWMTSSKIMLQWKNANPKYKNQLIWMVNWGVQFLKSVCFLINIRISKLPHTGKNTESKEMLWPNLRKSKDFWPTIKRFLSKKGQDGATPVVLSEGGKVVTDQTEVCAIFNNFFCECGKRHRYRGKTVWSWIFRSSKY